MTDERAVRMAQETTALAVAIRTYTDNPDHHGGVCGPCVLCQALAKHDRQPAAG